LRVTIFFHLTCLAWLFFRAESFAQVGQMLTALATDLNGPTRNISVEGLQAFLSCSCLLATAQLIQWHRKDMRFLLNWPMPLRAAAYAAGLLGFVFFGEFDGGAFIYFQF